MSKNIDAFLPPATAARLITDRTIVLIPLISFEFVLSDFGTFFEESPLLREHNCKRIRIMPILIDPCDLSLTAFQKIDRLESNKIPIRQLGRNAYHNHLQSIVAELSAAILAKADSQSRIDAAWQEAQTEHSAEAYMSFHRKYTISKYGQRSLAAYKQLLERKLWKEALAFNSAEFYLKYLKESPLRQHQNKAITKIVALENDEKVYREDMNNNTNLGILLEYKSKFRETGRLNEVNDKLFEIFSKPINHWTKERPEIKTEANYLNYEIHNKCSPDEAFTFDLFEKVKRDIELNIDSLIKQKITLKESLWVYLAVGTFVLLLLLMILSWIYAISFSKNTWYFWIVMGLGAYYFSFRGLIRIQRDINKYNEKLAEVRKEFAQLKIAFLTFDKLKQEQVGLYFNNTEEWLAEMDRRNLGYYLFEKKVKEDQYDMLSRLDNPLERIETAS